MHLSINHFFLLATAAAGHLFLSCGENSLVDSIKDTPSPRPPEATKPLLFSVGQQNTSRAIPLQQAGYFNFGVFAFVDQDVGHPVIDNYLVGYYDPKQAYGQQAGSTFGDPAHGSGLSYWMYEGMGSSEYDGTFAGQPLTDKHRSNIATQQMYYWNLASHTTSFYAYAPYFHGAKAVSFDYANRRLLCPEGMLVDGYSDDGLEHEYLIASSVVDSCNYGNDVNLVFRRLNCRVAVHFYNTVEGYSAEVLKVEGRPDGEYYHTAGAKVSFADSVQVTLDNPRPHGTDEPLRFAAPTTSPIGTTRDLSSPSPTIYYGLPKPISTGGFTFYVTYRLTSESDGSQITLTDVKALVPPEKCCWKSNVSYTYIFKIAQSKANPGDPTVSLDGYVNEESSPQPDDSRIPICN